MKTSLRPLFSSVVVPIDFSTESERAIDLAARFAAHGSAVTVLHVLPTTPLDMGRVLQQRERAAAERTTAAADQLGILNAAQASEAPARTLFVGPFRGEAVRDFSSAGQEWGARLAIPLTTSWRRPPRPTASSSLRTTITP